MNVSEKDKDQDKDKDMGEEKGGKEDIVELMLGEIELLPWASVGDLCVSEEVKVGAEADLSSELVGVRCFSFLFLSLWD